MNNNYSSQIPPGMLMRAMKNEEDAIAYHDRLRTMTSDNENINIIINILQNETNHLNLFSNLYLELFEERAELHGGVYPQIVSFVDGVKLLITKALYAYDFYKNIYTYDPNIEVQNVFLRVALDENNHAAKLNYIYEKFLESRLT